MPETVEHGLENKKGIIEVHVWFDKNFAFYRYQLSRIIFMMWTVMEERETSIGLMA